MSSDAERPVALLAADARGARKPSNYPEPSSPADGGARQAAARRPVRAHELRRQPDPARARRVIGAAPRAHQAGRVRLHPRRAADADHRRRPDRAQSPACAPASRREPATRIISSTKRTEDVVYLEIGDRTPGDAVTYPDDDIRRRLRRRQVALRPQGRNALLTDGSRRRSLDCFASLAMTARQ